MKRIIIWLVILSIVGGSIVVAYNYFKGSDKHLQLIPKNALMIGSIDYISLASKADLKKMQEMEFFKDIQEKAMKEKDSPEGKKFAEILKNPFSSGINLMSDIYFFSAGFDNKMVFAVDVDIKDEAQFRGVLKSIYPDNKIIAEKNYHAIYNDGWAMAWNEKGLLIATIQESYGEPGLFKKLFEESFNRKRSESIIDNKYFRGFAASKKDISLFMNMGEYSKLTERLSPIPIAEPLTKMWNGTYYIISTTFENNRIHTTWNLKSDNKDVEKMNYFRDKGLPAEMLGMITLKETYALMAISMEPKKILDLVDQVPTWKDMKEEFATRNGLTVKDLETLFGGDMAWSLNDFVETTPAKMEDGMPPYYQPTPFPKITFSLNFSSGNKEGIKKLLSDKMMRRPDNIYTFSMDAEYGFYLAENKTGFTFTDDSILAKNVSVNTLTTPAKKDWNEVVLSYPASFYVDLDFSHYPLALRNYASRMAGEGFYNQFITYTKILKDFRCSGKFTGGEMNLNLAEGEGNSLYRLVAQADLVYKMGKTGRPL